MINRLSLKRGVVTHSLVLATSFLTCTALQADQTDKPHSEKAETFIQKALSGGQMEIQMGQLAQQKAQSQEVKNLGGALVRDHTQANQRLQQLATSKNIKVEQYTTPTATSA